MRQHSTGECGAACLAMVLGFHGRPVRLRELTEATVGTRDTTNARRMIEVAAAFGLEGRAISAAAADLGAVGRSAILHWNASHFVVLDRIGRRRIRILDPATGRRVVRRDEFQRSFSGVALIFEPASTFEQQTREAAAARGARSPFNGRLGTVGRLATVAVLERLSIFVVPLLAQLTIDRIAGQTGRPAWTLVGRAIAGALLLQAASTALHERFRLSLRSQLDSEQFSSSVRRLLRSPLEFFDRRSIDDLAAGVEMNTLVREIVSRHAITAVAGGSAAVLVLLWILRLDPVLALVFIVIAVVRLAIVELSQRLRLPRLQYAAQLRYSAQSYLRRSLSAIGMVKSMGLEDRAFTSWQELFTAQRRHYQAQGLSLSWLNALSTSAQLASTVGVVMAGAIEMSRGRITLGGMAGALLITESFLVAVHDMWSGVHHVLTLPSYSERIHDVPDTRPPDAGQATSPGAGAIRLDRVSFRYGPVSGWALEDVSTTIAPGQLVAVVGPSGAGKSTLAKLLAGLLVPSQGAITRDAGGPAALVRENEPLFAGTIRSNIVLGGLLDAADDAVVQAAARAQVHADIMKMPRQYDTLLLDGGATLSGGERQRIALARVLTRQQPLLILDNATSHVDPITESAILDSLRSTGATLVAITNRLGLATRADRVLVMARGCIVEQGTHADLVERGGLYSDLWRAGH